MFFHCSNVKEKPTSIYQNFQNYYCLKCHTDWESSLSIPNRKQQTNRSIGFGCKQLFWKHQKMSKLKISLSCWRETLNHQIIETTHPRISKDPSKMRGLKTRTSQGSGMISSGHQWLEIPWFLGNTKKIHSTKTMSSETVHKRQPPMAVAWCETKDIAWRCWIPPGWCNLARLEVSSELFGAWKGREKLGSPQLSRVCLMSGYSYRSQSVSFVNKIMSHVWYVYV